MKLTSKLISLTLTVFAAVACGSGNQTKTPDISYSQYISGYTGGVLPEGKPIRVFLQGNIVSGPEVQLFSFSPKLSGTQKITGNNAVEFLPDASSIQPGVKYDCYFDIVKAAGLKDNSIEKFTFSFFVPEKEVYVTVDQIGIPSGNYKVAQITGSIEISAPGDPMLEISADGIKGAIDQESDLKYTFKISGVNRTREDKTITLVTKTGNGYKEPEKVEVTIPGTGEFKIIEAALEDNEGKPYIKVVFSQPLSTVPAGLVRVRWAGKNRLTQQGNILKVYYENFYEDSIILDVDGNVKSIHGVALGEDVQLPIKGSSAHPAVKLGIDGNIVPDAGNVILPFSAVNLKAVDVRIIKIFQSNVLNFLQDNGLNGDDNLRRSGRLVYYKTIMLDTEPGINLRKWQDFSINLSGLIKKEPGAIYRVRLSFKKEYSLYGNLGIENAKLSIVPKEGPTDKELAVWDIPNSYYWDETNWNEYEWTDRDNPEKPSYYLVNSRFPSINLLASDIGLIAKQSQTGKLWVAAASLSTSAPSAGTNIDVYNFQLQKIGTGKTDASGLTEISISGVPFVVVGTNGTSTSYLSVKDSEIKSTSRFDVGGSTLNKGLKAFIYGERGVWRPGDTLHLVMLLQDKGRALPQEHPVTLELYNPEGQFYSKLVNTNGKDGFYRFDVPTQEDDPTGFWNAQFKVGGSLFNKSVRVETVKPNRLKINTSFQSDILTAGANEKINISSNWLTGPPASGLKANAVMTLSNAGTFFKGYDGYIFKDPLKTLESESVTLVDTRLDNAGQASVSVTMPEASGAPGMLNAYILFSVMEGGGDESLTGVSMPLSPYSSYVGIKAPTSRNNWLETGKDHIFDIVTIDKNGKKIKGRQLEYKIYKLKWSWWWESRAEDLDSYVNSSSSNLVKSGKLTSTGNDSIALKIEYPDWGRYLVLVKDLESGHATGTTVVIDWPDYLGRASRKDPDALTMLTFSTDKTEYEIGETASIFIPETAGSGNALISLENSNRVISSKWISVSGKYDTVHKIKITEDMAPNFYVHVTLVQPHGNTGNDLPIRLYGVQPVKVNNPGSVLTPVISMADSIHPEEEFTIGISESKGKPMTYTIAIVDEGLLDLTAFKTPDPWNFMYAREALGISTWDIYDNVTGAISGKFRQMLSIGGDEQIILGSKKDNRFNPVVKVLGPFTLNNGKASHKVKLPMYVGSVRVMVTAGHEGAYGKADKTVAVKSPLMAVTTLPRVLGSGETVTVPVNVFALEDGIKDVTVSIKTGGAAVTEGASTVNLKFDSTGDKIAEFKIKGTAEGTAKVSITATSAGHKTQETIALPIINPSRPVVQFKYQTIEPGGVLTYKLQDKRQEASVIISGYPTIDYHGAYDYVKNYSYSCSEQLSARGIVLLSCLDRIGNSKTEEAKVLLEDIVKKLYMRQLPDGGFAYWSGAPNASSWVTSMAGLLLSGAKAKGVAVSAQVQSAWLNFQKNAANNYRNSNNSDLSDLDQAFRLYSMAVYGYEDNASMNRLKENKNISAQAKWMLACAYARCGKKQISESIISTIEAGFAEYKNDTYTYGSAYRDKAIAMMALVLAGRTGDAVTMAQELSILFGAGYISTQESAFAAMAMEELAKAIGDSPLKAEISVSGKTVTLDGASSLRAYNFAAADKEFSLKNLSGGPAYAVVSQIVKPDAGEVVPAGASGLKMDVKYARNDGTAINPSSIKQGTEFTATITITNTGMADDYSYLALSQFVPSGWEIFNERLFSADTPEENACDNMDIRDNGIIWYFDLEKGKSKTFKVKMRAAYTGQFSLPSVTCEMMYNNLVFARTASGKAEVTK